MERIEKIRKKPEHIRRSYVFFSVAICMFFILLIWFFSFSDNENIQNNSLEAPADLRKSFNELNQQKQSTQNTLNDIRKNIEQIPVQTKELKNQDQKNNPDTPQAGINP